VTACPPLELIAKVAGEPADAETVAHLASCARCAALIAEQREVRDLARSASVPMLARGRRLELAAEVMARADAAPRRRRVVRVATGVTIAVALAAAVIAIVLVNGGERRELATAPPPEPRPAVPPPRHPTVTPIVPTDRGSDAEPPPVVAASSGARMVRRTTRDRDVVELTDGNVSIDTQRSRDVTVIAGAIRIAIGKARVAVAAKHGVVESVSVFAGSVEVVNGGDRRVIRAGTVWHATTPRAAAGASTPTPGPSVGSGSASESAPTTGEIAMRAFRDGWIALRTGRNADAIAAFDRAVDPVVAEDAAFWAAVAAERAGSGADARRRYADFLARFPTSPRADSARAAIARLVP